jgi:outer membrane biosynthesis protein TonB
VGLLTFAALATVALIIGIAVSNPPADQHASLPDGVFDDAPPAHEPAPAPTAPPVDAAPNPAPPAPAEDATPPQDAPAEEPTLAPTPEAQEPAPPAEPEQPPAPAEDTTPVSTPALDVNAAADYVRAFYADLKQRRFEAAWPRLAEDLRASSGSFETWASGFDTTVRQSASDLVAKAAGPATVRVSLTLTAVDRDKHNCEVTRRYAVEWRLDLMNGKWRALHAEGKPIESPAAGVAASCSTEQPAHMAQNED